MFGCEVHHEQWLFVPLCISFVQLLNL